MTTSVIDLNRIRSLRTLEAIKKPLAEFIAFDPDIMKVVYTEDFGWGNEDYEADRERAIDLLERVERRTKSLEQYLARTEIKDESQPLSESF